jgi:hypothetical protein
MSDTVTKTRKIKIGDVLIFKASWQNLYGLSATVKNVHVAVSRPFGARTTLIDMRTSNGTAIQWPLSLVRARFGR